MEIMIVTVFKHTAHRYTQTWTIIKKEQLQACWLKLQHESWLVQSCLGEIQWVTMATDRKSYFSQPELEGRISLLIFYKYNLINILQI